MATRTRTAATPPPRPRKPKVAPQEVLVVDEEAPLDQALVDLIDDCELELIRGTGIISAALWKEGDALAYKYHLNDQQLGRLAKKTGVSKSTLSERRRISQIFPADKRNPDVSWTVHQALARLDAEEDEAVRTTMLHEDRSAPWTVEEARFAVKHYLEEKAPDAEESGTQEFKSGMACGSTKITARKKGTRLEVVVYASPDSEPQVVTLEGDSVTLIFKVESE